MAINRMREFESTAGNECSSQGRPAMPAIPPGFALCPPQLMAVESWQQEIYRQAFEHAQQAAAIPRFHRQLFSVWN